MTELLAVLLQAQPRPGGVPSPTTAAAPPIFGYIPIVIFFLISVLLPVALLGASRLVQRRVFEQDRKSTRLNSSHTVISYAVFCLKKKRSSTCTACHTSDGEPARMR